jgi:hypothetical protein
VIKTFNQALAYPLFHTVSRNNDLGIFRVRIGELNTVITVKVLKFDIDCYETRESHAIQVDFQAGPYRVRKWPHGGPGEALAEALNTYKFYYKIAVDQGLVPKERWLVLDTSFAI